MARAYQECPKDIPLENPLGPAVLLTVTSAHHVHVRTADHLSITVNRVQHTLSLHLEDQGEGFQVKERWWESLYMKRCDSFLVDATEAAKKKVILTLTPLVQEWARKNVHVLIQAEKVDVNNKCFRLEQEIEESQKEIDRCRGEIARLEFALKSFLST